jgi:Glycosyltransferase family 87
VNVLRHGDAVEQAVTSPKAASVATGVSIPYYVKGLALGVPIYFVAIHLWAWVLIVPGFLRTGRPDFRQIYSSAYMVRTGHGSQLYDYNAQRDYQDRVVSQQDLPLPFLRPAYEALLFAPLSRLPFRAAYFVWAVVNLILLGACYTLLLPWTTNLRLVFGWLPAAILFGFYPIAWAFVMGQDSVFLLLLLLTSFSLLTRGRSGLAGAVLGLGLFKLQIALPVAFLFLVWRRWKFLLGFWVSGGVAAAISICVTGMAGARAYVAYLSSFSGLRSASTTYPVLWQMMANVHGFVFGLLATRVPKLGQEVLTIAVSVAILLWTVWRGLREKRDSDLLLLALPCTILVGQYAFMHDLSVLLVPVVVLLDRYLPSEQNGPARERWIARVAALMFVAPICDSYFPQHTYLVALAVLALLWAVQLALDSRPHGVVYASSAVGAL